MPILNTTIFDTRLQTAINSLSTSTSTLDILVLTEALTKLQTAQDTTPVSVYTSKTLPASPSSNNQIIFLDDIDNFAIFSEGNWYSLDGTLFPLAVSDLYAWGNGAQGKLGNNTTTNLSSPNSVVGGINTWCQVSSSFKHTAAVTLSGKLFTWGCNGHFQIGDGTGTSRSSPVSILGGFTDWCQVAGGYCHTAAVRTNGTLWTWGSGGDGRLGDGTTTDKCSPVSVVGGFTDWCQVSAGEKFTVALRQNGTIWTFGWNNKGQLGRNNQDIHTCSPVSIVGGITDWAQISAGFEHVVALRQNGTVWAWGDGGKGQLGNNFNTNRSSPVSVVGGFTDWCQVSAGTCHTAAVRTNGTLWTWGDAGNGRLGHGCVGLAANRSSPVSVIGGFTDWCQVSAGGSHTAAVRTNGTLWAWGDGVNGRLGDYTTVDKCSPVSVVGGFTNWCKVSSGDLHTLGITFFDINL